ncbi:MAG: hypothetical protein E7554_01435 [Ruminococcaceae bacterium]|nr:hypothetical protein [Oscillospiraceae bacterium]
MINISDCRTKSFPVECKTGVIADSATGRRLVFLDGMYLIPEGGARVNKNTIRTYYTSVWSVSDSMLRYTVFRASAVNKHGLVWCEEFSASFVPESTQIKQRGSRTLTYWLIDKGSLLLTPDILEVPGDPVTPAFCVERLWNRPEYAPNFTDMDMTSFAAKWINGDIEEYFDPAYRLKQQRFGLEIEFTGMSRCRAAEIIARYFDTSVRHVGGGYDTYAVLDKSGRTWRVMSDGSVHAFTRRREPTSDSSYRCELVTPVCEYRDITEIQKIVRKLRHAGMYVNQSCGIHVHVDAEGHTAKSLKNLANIMASKEDLIFKALAIHPTREHWCQKIDRRFLTKMQDMNDDSELDDVKFIWYDGDDFSCFHYDSTRYHMLNLHSLWQGKGIEFRMFNSVTHAGKIKAYIQLCLAISNQAKEQTWVSFRKRKTSYEKRQFRTWLVQMGLIGDEFATARLHLLANLSDERTNAA